MADQPKKPLVYLISLKTQRGNSLNEALANHYWLVVEPTQLKNMSQNKNLSQRGVNIKNL